MARVVPLNDAHDPKLADPVTGKALEAEKVVDISDHCHRGKRCLLLYTSTSEGERFVQISRPSAEAVYGGFVSHFRIESGPWPERFVTWALDLGLDVVRLSRLVRQNAPQAS